jgi:hypothetical protein
MQDLQPGWKLRIEAAKTTLTLKVSDKGAVSLYGMGRFPTTLYAAQWERILDAADQIRQFIDDNKAKLGYKCAACGVAATTHVRLTPKSYPCASPSPANGNAPTRIIQRHHVGDNLSAGFQFATSNLASILPK